jgi:hypothetical protein
MRSLKILTLCFITSMALGAAVSTAALAARNPKYTLCKVSPETRGQWMNGFCTVPGRNASHETRQLEESQTRGFELEPNGMQELSVPSAKMTIICKKLKAKAGAILIGGEPGASSEILAFEECEIEGSPTCLINKEKAGKAQIVTNVLSSKLGYLTEKAEMEENLRDVVNVLKPSSGTVFTELEIEKEAGGSCPLASIEKMKLPVKGELACESIDGAEHLITHELNCPETAKKEYWLQNSKEEPEKITLKKLELATLPATYVGRSKLKLSGIEEFQALWYC